MSITTPEIAPPWGETASGSPDIVRPSDGFIQTGWPLTSIPPSRGFFNWLLHFCSNGIRYLCTNGIIGWNTSETLYVTGAVVRGPDGGVYMLTGTASTGLAPANDPANWRFLWNAAGNGTGLAFGDGSDGDLTVSGASSLAAGNPGEETHLNNLTIGASGVLTTNRRILRVRGLLSIASGGYIQPRVASALNASGASGGTGVTDAWMCGSAGGDGGAGGADGSNSGSTSNPSGGGTGGSGGLSGAPHSGGSAGSQSFPANSNLRQFLCGQAGWWNGFGLRGGTGGGGGGGAQFVAGGGGGAGGDVLIVIARTVVIASATALRSFGGNGAAGADGGVASGGGGGGGGGGGCVLLVSGTKTGPALTSACVAAGTFGAGGPGGTIAGNPGTAGSAGKFAEIVLS
jgi:hypothetical protein